jgi:hypothetical protein
MTQSSLPVLQDAYFQVSLSFAKGAAQRVGAKELSPLFLLVGFQLAQRSTTVKVPRAIADNREAIARAASRLGLDPGQEIKPLKRGTLIAKRRARPTVLTEAAGHATVEPVLDCDELFD